MKNKRFPQQKSSKSVIWIFTERALSYLVEKIKTAILKSTRHAVQMGDSYIDLPYT
jgi:hypothetical protein